MRTTKAQISLRIRAVWSAPLLFAAKTEWYLQFIYPKFVGGRLIGEGLFEMSETETRALDEPSNEHVRRSVIFSLLV